MKRQSAYRHRPAQISSKQRKGKKKNESAEIIRDITGILMIGFSALILLPGRLDTITPWLILGSAVILSFTGLFCNDDPWKKRSLPDLAWILSLLFLTFPINNCTCSGSTFILAAVLIFLVLAGLNLLAIFKRPDGRSRKGTLKAIGVFIVILFFSLFWVRSSNTMLDTAKPQQILTTIVDMNLRTTRGSSGCYVKVQCNDVDGAQKTKRVEVSLSVYKAFHIGDPVVLWIGQGFWGSPYL